MVSGTIQVYDLNFTLLVSFNAHTARIWKLLFIPELNLLVSSSDDQLVKVWSTLDWSLVLTYHGHAGGVTSLVYVGGGIIASSSGDWQIKIWNVLNGNAVATIFPSTTSYAIIFIPILNLLAAGLANGEIRVYNLTNNINNLKFQLTAHQSWVSEFMLLNETVLASASFDQTIRLWSISSFGLSLLFNLTGHTGGVNALNLFAPNLLASASDDSNLIVWDLSIKTKVSTLIGHTNGIFHSLELYCLASGENQILISGSNDMSIRLWDSSTYQQISSFNTGKQINALVLVGSYINDCKKFWFSFYEINKAYEF